MAKIRQIMSPDASAVERNSKFTRGEKCLFAHVVITFCLIIAIVIGYYCHACLVQHRGNLGVNWRRSSGEVEGEVEEYRCVGAVLVRDGQRERTTCAAALLTATWSLVPARCVVARARPALAHLLPFWTIRYETNITGILRGIAHPEYDADDAANDVGLFEHETQLNTHTLACAVPNQELTDEVLNEDILQIVGWSNLGGRWVSHVHGLPREQCAQFTAPVVERREACVSAYSLPGGDSRSLLDGVLFAGLEMVAIASWGNGIDSFPLVVVDIAPFKDWLDLTIAATASFKLMDQKHPNFGRNDVTWENWWRELVRLTFEGNFPVNVDIGVVANKLIDEFKTTRCWSTANGTEHLLNVLKKSNIGIGIISNFDPRLIEILQNVSLYNTFDFVTISYHVGYSKPDRRIFESALKAYKKPIKPSECLHIGDDLDKDYKGAKSAGWHAILLGTTRNETKINSDHVFKSIPDLMEALAQNRIKLQ